MRLELVNKLMVEDKVKGKKRVEYLADVKCNNKTVRVKVDKSRYFRAEEGKLIKVTYTEINEGTVIETED